LRHFMNHFHTAHLKYIAKHALLNVMYSLMSMHYQQYVIISLCQLVKMVSMASFSFFVCWK